MCLCSQKDIKRFHLPHPPTIPSPADLPTVHISHHVFSSADTLMQHTSLPNISRLRIRPGNYLFTPAHFAALTARVDLHANYVVFFIAENNKVGGKIFNFLFRSVSSSSRLFQVQTNVFFPSDRSIQTCEFNTVPVLLKRSSQYLQGWKILEHVHTHSTCTLVLNTQSKFGGGVTKTWHNLIE